MHNVWKACELRIRRRETGTFSVWRWRRLRIRLSCGPSEYWGKRIRNEYVELMWAYFLIRICKEWTRLVFTYRLPPSWFSPSPPMYMNPFWSSSSHHQLSLENSLYVPFFHLHSAPTQTPSGPLHTITFPAHKRILQSLSSHPFSAVPTPRHHRATHAFIVCLPWQVPSFSPQSTVYFSSSSSQKVLPFTISRLLPSSLKTYLLCLTQQYTAFFNPFLNTLSAIFPSLPHLSSNNTWHFSISSSFFPPAHFCPFPP